MRLIHLLTAALGCAIVLPAHALNWSFWDIDVTLNNRISMGAAWRMEDRDKNLIGKLNIEGQQHLCEPDDCLSFDGNPEPNQRLVDARGAFVGHIGDDGNLNYDKYDAIAAVVKANYDLTINWENVVVVYKGLSFFDAVNNDFEEFNPNTNYQEQSPNREEFLADEIAKRHDTLEAFVAWNFNLFDRDLTWSVGQQRVRWGESLLIAINSVSEWNPPEAQRLTTPGAQISEVFQPSGLITLSGPLFENMGFEAIYQYDWRPVKAPAAGSYFSFNDPAGGRETALISLGQISEDPYGDNMLNGLGSLISSTSFTARTLDPRTPDDDGQYGLRLNYYFENLLGGTEVSGYYMHYHSRYPYLSAFATDDSCLRDSTDVVGAALACGGFNGQENPDLDGVDPATAAALSTAISAAQTAAGLLGIPAQEPLPIDTFAPFLDYPEDIDMYGVSWNSTVFGLSFAGEVSYRPNIPLQLHLTDVIFAALTPALPRQDIDILGAATIPAANVAVPSFFLENRLGGEIDGGQEIKGWERHKVWQTSMTGIKIFGPDNWFGAEQIIWATEIGGTYISDFPSLSDVQFETGTLQRTHASPGADGSGSGGVPDSRRLNPHQQTDGFADRFAWGYRMLIQPEYNGIWRDINFKPQLIWVHDIKGTVPFPISNFIEGSKQMILGLDFELSQQWSTRIQYQGFYGSRGNHNYLVDRDNLGFSVAYSF